MTKASRRSQGYLFGHDRQGKEFLISNKERAAHMHVIGASGTGKSKFLERLIRQDLKNRKVGACVIDPHGKLVDDIMDYVAHRAPHLASRIVLFEPASQTDQVTGFNPIPGQFDSLSNTVDSIVESILFAWGQSENDYPRIKTWLYNILYLVVANDLTLVEALPVINIHAKDERKALYQRINSVSVRTAWEDFETYPSREKIATLEGMQNRLRRLLNNEYMRRVFSQQRSALDLGRIMADKKILLVSLRDWNRIHHENLRMLGIMILKEIYRVGMQRRERSRPPAFHVYIDEFGQYITPVVAAALDEIRKKNVFFTVAHQHLSQLENDDMGKQILSSVMTNCLLKVAFGGLTPYDADQMSKLMWTGKYKLYRQKHRQPGTKVRTHESTRDVFTEGESQTDGTSHSDSQSETWSFGVTEGRSESETLTHTDGGSEGASETNTRGRSSSTTWNQGRNRSHTSGGSLSKGSSRSTGTNTSHSTTHGTSTTNSSAETKSHSSSSSSSESGGSSSSSNESRSNGHSTTFHPDGHGTTRAVHSMSDGRTTAITHSSNHSYSTNSSQSESRSRTTSTSHSSSESKTTGGGNSKTDSKSMNHSTSYSDTDGTSSSHGGSQGLSSSHSAGKTRGTSYSDARAQSETESYSESRSKGGSRSTSDGTSHTVGRSKSVSRTPYDEKEEYTEITSVTLWTPQELQLMQQGKLMNLPVGIALMKNANGTPEYVKVPHVRSVTKTETGSMRKLAKAEERILTANARYYAPVEFIEQEAEERQTPIFGAPLRLDEQSLDDDPVVDDDDPGHDPFTTS